VNHFSLTAGCRSSANSLTANMESKSLISTVQPVLSSPDVVTFLRIVVFMSLNDTEGALK